MVLVRHHLHARHPSAGCALFSSGSLGLFFISNMLIQTVFSTSKETYLFTGKQTLELVTPFPLLQQSMQNFLERDLAVGLLTMCNRAEKPPFCCSWFRERKNFNLFIKGKQIMFLTEDVFLILGKTSILEHRKESSSGQHLQRSPVLVWTAAFRVAVRDQPSYSASQTSQQQSRLLWASEPFRVPSLHERLVESKSI